MSYIDQQRRALGSGNEFVVKVVNRKAVGSPTIDRPETNWLDIDADKLERIMAIIGEQ